MAGAVRSPVFQHHANLQVSVKLHTMFYTGTPYARPSLLASSPYCNSSMPRRQPRVDLHPVDLASWDDGVWGDSSFTESQPDELDEAWPYRFKSGDMAWVSASDGYWYRGKVVGQAKQGRTRSEDGLFWCVEFHMAKVKVRKWFAPLNGEIKPDIEHTYRLLNEAGCLESDSDQ